MKHFRIARIIYLSKPNNRCYLDLKIARGPNSLRSIECDLLHPYSRDAIWHELVPYGLHTKRILWVLSENDVKLDRSTLRTMVGMRYALLDPIIEELAEEGKIKIQGEMIVLHR